MKILLKELTALFCCTAPLFVTQLRNIDLNNTPIDSGHCPGPDRPVEAADGRAVRCLELRPDRLFGLHQLRGVQGD